MIDQATQDVVHAIRNFRRTPGFTAIAALTLALGIGATTAVFSIVDAVLLNPLPFLHSDRLVVAWEKLTHEPNAPPIFDSLRDFEIWRKNSQAFEQIAAATWATGSRIMTGAGPARNVLAMPVSVDFFALLGIQPELGRTFQPGDLSRNCTVVLSHRFWLQTFNGDRQLAAKHIALDDSSCAIIGVMPASFHFYPDAAPMWTLITPASVLARDPEHANVGVFARLRPGVSIGRAQSELDALRSGSHPNDPPGSERSVAVYPLAEMFAYLSGPTLRLSIAVLFGAVCFVLLIACVNVANLLLGRSLVRQKELAVRAALGAGRGRLVRQLLTETLLLAAAGAIPGILLAKAAIHYFRLWNPIELPPGNPVSVNPVVLVFTAALALLTAAVSGLFPALRASHADPIDALKTVGRTATLGRSAGKFRQALAAAQVALSISLLAGAGLLIESVNRLASVPLGFDTARAFTMSIHLPTWSYTTPAQRASFYRSVLDRAVTLPGIESAAFATSLPLTGGRFASNTLVVQGKPITAAARDVGTVSITPDYFHVMRVPLQIGRLFDARDRDTAEPVAIVNEALARKFFPNENPIGKHIGFADPPNRTAWFTIVGVAADEKSRNFFHEMRWEEIPLVFRPLAQRPQSSAALIVRTIHDRNQLAAAIQKQIRALDNNVPATDIETLDEQLSRTLAYPRFRAVVLGAFAALALLLAGVGLYGVLAQATVQRTQEFGVRMALGAERRDVLALVIRQGILLTATGVVFGLMLALALTRILRTLLFGVQAGDPWIWAAVSLTLALVALLATSVPAWRASRVDPLTALRYE